MEAKLIDPWIVARRSSSPQCGSMTLWHAFATVWHEFTDSGLVLQSQREHVRQGRRPFGKSFQSIPHELR
jgi:hypothetical protein